MIRNYAIAFLVIEAILVGLVFIDAPVNSPLYMTIMSLIIIVIVCVGATSIFYAFERTKNKKANQVSMKIGTGLVAIFGFLILRLISHLALLQIVTLSKFASQISGVTQVALILTFFYIQYDILKNLRK